MVTIAIMAVLIGGSLLSYNLVTRTNVKKAASLTNDVLSSTRVNAKAKATNLWAVKISYDAATPVVEVYKGSAAVPGEDPEETQSLPKSVNLKVKYYDKDGNVVEKSVGNGQAYDASALRIYYEQLTGAISKITCEKSGIGSAEVIAANAEGYCDLIFEHQKEYTVRIYLATGKQEVIQ